MKQDFLKTLDKHQGIVHKVSRMYRDTPQDQEDLFQEIVLQLWRSFPDFRQQSKVSTWMYRIALNTAIAAFRKKKVELVFKAEIPKIIDGGQDRLRSENEDRMFAAFKVLNQAEKAVMALYLEDYPYQEIASIIGITENHVAVIISRVKTKLKNLLT